MCSFAWNIPWAGSSGEDSEVLTKVWDEGNPSASQSVQDHPWLSAEGIPSISGTTQFMSQAFSTWQPLTKQTATKNYELRPAEMTGFFFFFFSVCGKAWILACCYVLACISPKFPFSSQQPIVFQFLSDFSLFYALEVLAGNRWHPQWGLTEKHCAEGLFTEPWAGLMGPTRSRETPRD